jgi:hypothetical protein
MATRKVANAGMAKAAHHVGASKKGFRGAIGGSSPAGVGHTAGVNYKAFGHKFSSARVGNVGGGMSGRARKKVTPHGIKPGKTEFGIVDGHGSSNKNQTAKANSLFKVTKGLGRTAKDGGSNAC